MKSLLFICFFSFSLAFAQNSAQNWYIGLQAGLGKSFRTLSKSEGGVASTLPRRNQYELPAGAWNTDFLAGKRIFRGLWIEGKYGISKLEILYQEYFPNDDLLYEYQQKYYFNDISLALKLYTNKGKFKGFIFLGPEANITVTWREILTTYTQNQPPIIHNSYPDSGGYIWLVFSMQGGAGLSYQLTDRLSLEARFTYKENFTPSRERSSILDRLNYKAGNLGLLIHL